MAVLKPHVSLWHFVLFLTPPSIAENQIAVLGSNYSAELLEAIDAGQLPKMYGGACDCKAGGAGDCCVPVITLEKAQAAYVSIHNAHFLTHSVSCTVDTFL